MVLDLSKGLGLYKNKANVLGHAKTKIFLLATTIIVAIHKKVCFIL